MRTWLLKAFRLATVFPWRRFEAALHQPKQAQMQTLEEILRLANAPGIERYADFQNLPLRNYEDIEAQILAAEQSGQNFLSHHKPKTHEPTSGSSGARKLIPYTPALLHSFGQLFLLWAHDLLSHGPRLKGGRIYFSVSPQFHETKHGLNDDSDYLTGLTGLLFKAFVLVPPQIKKLKNPDNFFYVLARYWLGADDLEVISIWSPSFMLAILDYIHAHAHNLIASGTQAHIQVEGLTFTPGPISALKQAELQKPHPHWQNLFPGLKLISAWGAQNSATAFQQLKAHFPDVHVQAKGLLATEAPLTFPSEHYQAFLPLLNAVFFEFLDAEGQLWRLDQVEMGKTYELVISQKSGLLRYRLKDLVKIEKKVFNTPCFEFMGRGENLCDLVGEKLNEAFVAEIAKRLCPEVYLCLVPDLATPGYTLFSEQSMDLERFEQGLRQSPHYHNARELKQLAPLQGQLKPDLPHKLKQFFSQKKGMRLGDIKDSYLYSRETNGELLAFLKQAD
ncbi:MAG: GH3 auxin-responsive promoter family protein [Candidatus Sericytochromatia bacterium]